MRSNRRKISAYQQHLHQLYIAQIYFVLLLIGDVRRLFIRAFDQAHPYSLYHKLFEIFFATAEISLDYCTNMLKLLVHAQRNINRTLSIC